MPNRLRVNRLTQGIADFDTLGTVVAEYAHFNQLMRRQCRIGFLDDCVRQTLLTDHHNRMEMVRARFQFQNFFGVQFGIRHFPTV